MPYYAADSSGSEKFDGGQFGSPNMKEEGEENKAESDDEHTQWLNDLGVSQDVSCSTYAKVYALTNFKFKSSMDAIWFNVSEAMADDASSCKEKVANYLLLLFIYVSGPQRKSMKIGTRLN